MNDNKQLFIEKYELWEFKLLKTQNHDFWFIFILNNTQFIFIIFFFSGTSSINIP